MVEEDCVTCCGSSVEETGRGVVGGWGETFEVEYEDMQGAARAAQLRHGTTVSDVFPVRDPRWVWHGPVPAVYARYEGDAVVHFWHVRFTGAFELDEAMDDAETASACSERSGRSERSERSGRSGESAAYLGDDEADQVSGACFVW